MMKRIRMDSQDKYVDFADVETTFADKSDKDLKEALWLFRMMNMEWLVDLSTWIAGLAIRWRIPLVKWLVKRTIFRQFVGGETLKESETSIEKLWKSNILTVLDYGAEGRSLEFELEEAKEQFIHAVTFAASNESTPVVSIKVSALAQNELLEKMQSAEQLTEDEKNRAENIWARVETICSLASQLGVKIFIDAEESWIQDTIDRIVESMMEKYNRNGVIVYQTFQMYRHDRLAYLKASYETAKSLNFFLGAKLVRGAYMEKERERAIDRGYDSPIHIEKAAVDQDYNDGLLFCAERYKEIATCAATHNMESCLLFANYIGENQLPRNHPNLNFCQLYGMSDHLTYNLASSGYNVAKYVVYGRVEEVVPYLARRAEENTATKGEFGREYKLIKQELERRLSLTKA